MKKNIPKKMQISNITVLSSNIESLKNNLPSVKEEIDLWNWWNKLEQIWKDIFLINYMFERDFSLSDNLISIDDIVEGIYETFNSRYSREYSDKDIIITTDLLKKIVNIKVLDCALCELNNCEPLEMMKSLTYLDLSHNSIIDISPIKNMLTIEYLDINNNHDLYDFSNIISTLVNINFLWLDKTPIFLTENRFDSLIHLSTMKIIDNEIAEDFNFSVFPKLECIYSDNFIYNSKLRNRFLPSLKKLVVSHDTYNDICDRNYKIYHDFYISNNQCRLYVDADL